MAAEELSAATDLGTALCGEDAGRPTARACSLAVEGRKMMRDESLRRMGAKRRRLKRMGLELPVERSIGSQGSSGVFDLDCHQEQGSSSHKDVVSPASILSSHNRANNTPSSEEEKPSDKMTETTLQAKGVERNMVEEMPYVSTRGEGPNGKFIQGFLYKYGNGVEVRIVCVCHGSFLTPAEFVKHAGGGDVVHPLRHIIVSCPPFSS